MRKTLFLFLLIFSINSVSIYAQSEFDYILSEDDFETAEGYERYKQNQEFLRDRKKIYNEQLGVVEYKGLRYEGCRAIVYTFDDIVYIQIGQPERDYFTPFLLDFKLKLIEGKLPTGNLSFSDKQTSENDSDNYLRFTWNYEDWRLATQTSQAKQASVHIQSFSKDYYNISGSMVLDVEEKDVVDFMFWGPLSYENIEVTKVFHFNPEDYFHNQGQLTIGEKTVSMPFSFKDRKPDSQKIYILDKFVALNGESELEYGVYFEFPTGEFPIGIFKADNISQPFKAAFFNKHKTEYPSETELNIKWDKKKQKYDISYFMNFSNGQTVKGSYSGKIPESTF